MEEGQPKACSVRAGFLIKKTKINYMSDQNQTNEVFPKATTEGFEILNETDAALNIETKQYENGNTVKRIVLSDKRVAIVRELKGKDMDLTSRIHRGDDTKFLMAMAVIATKLNDENVTIEDLEEMKGKDYNKIRIAVSQLNF